MKSGNILLAHPVYQSNLFSSIWKVADLQKQAYTIKNSKRATLIKHFSTERMLRFLNGVLKTLFLTVSLTRRPFVGKLTCVHSSTSCAKGSCWQNTSRRPCVLQACLTTCLLSIMPLSNNSERKKLWLNGMKRSSRLFKLFWNNFSLDLVLVKG